MTEHLKLFSVIVNLVIGTSITVVVLQKAKSYGYEFLKPLSAHIILFNTGLMTLFILKYLDLNLPQPPVDSRPSLGSDAIGLIVYILIMAMAYAMLRIVRGFQKKPLSRRLNASILFGSIVFLLGYSIKFVLSAGTLYYKIHYHIYENVGGVIILAELVLLVRLLILGKRHWNGYRRNMTDAFGWLYLSRYVFIFLAFLVPQPFRVFSAITYLNLIPLIWLKFYFEKYAESMLQYVEDKMDLEAIVQRYNLSRREMEILRHLLDGKSNKEIEETLFISYHTVKNHVYNLYQKLGVKTRYELIHMITKKGEPRDRRDRTKSEMTSDKSEIIPNR